MSTDITAFEQKMETKFGRWKWVIGLGAIIVLGPILWAAAYSVLGAGALALSLAITGFIILAIVHAAPVVLMKIKNAQINAVKAEATKNPIPTLLNQWEQDVRDNTKISDAITEEDAAVNTYESAGKKLYAQAKLSESEYKNFEEEVVLMRDGVRQDEDDYKELVQKTAEFKIEIDKAEGIWTLEMARQAANAKMMSARAQTALDRIARETAFDAVSKASALSRAQLRQRMRDRSNGKPGGVVPSLTNNPSPRLSSSSAVQDVVYVNKGIQK